MYDVAIIGAGPAGLSAALNFKLHNKEIIWFGSKDLSNKVEVSEKIANYPGMGYISGHDLNEKFTKHMEEMDLELTDKLVTMITKSKKGYNLLADNEIYQAKTLLLAVGVIAGKGFVNEKELLGRGVSYCATCDGFLYKGKDIVVYCQSEKYEHEIDYLAGLANHLYVAAGFKGYQPASDNIEVLPSPITEILPGLKAGGVKLKDGSEIKADGVFILRNAVAPTTLLPDLEMDGAHIVVNRKQETNLAGCYAAGDCTGAPYQITKAVGEGNVAAHSIISYLAALEKESEAGK